MVLGFVVFVGILLCFGCVLTLFGLNSVLAVSRSSFIRVDVKHPGSAAITWPSPPRPIRSPRCPARPTTPQRRWCLARTPPHRAGRTALAGQTGHDESSQVLRDPGVGLVDRWRQTPASASRPVRPPCAGGTVVQVAVNSLGQPEHGTLSAPSPSAISCLPWVAGNARGRSRRVDG